MTLRGTEVLSVKSPSAEAIRESLQKIWESCMPRKKSAVKPSGNVQNQYFIPDLSKFIFLRKTEGEELGETEKLEKANGKTQKNQIKSSVPPKMPTTHEVLHWRTCQRSQTESET